MKPTFYQSNSQRILREGKSLILVAPTGLGKTFAVTGDLQDGFRKTVYAVPLRALCAGIKEEIAELPRNPPIQPAIHQGDTQESKQFFGEEVIVTTYDQVVCGVPGLPLSLPLKAGHAVAAALLMSRLILDEAHLAWGISREALSILLAIVEFRQKLGLQTVLQTATMPKDIAKRIKERLKLDEIIVLGQGEFTADKDEGLAFREKNRKLEASLVGLGLEGKGDRKKLSFKEVDEKLLETKGKRIFFCNTVGRLQETYDRLIEAGLVPETVIMLHNRMPHPWRQRAENQARERFGKGKPDGDWLLLTNQVAEAGLDISAPLVISDPAPVDTLVQRAGRCARWFREGETRGRFLVLKAPNETERRKLATPYRNELVDAGLESFPKGEVCWARECEWVDKAWGGDPKKAIEAVEQALDKTAFALNLFDRAAQERTPGAIARAFREILSIEVAIENSASPRDLQQLLNLRRYPETSSVSLRRAWSLISKAQSKTKIVRYDEGHLVVQPADSLQLGDVLVLPSTVGYLHEAKGLCFVENGSLPEGPEVKTSSEWNEREGKWDKQLAREDGRRQGLFEHVSAVVKGTRKRLTSGESEGSYRKALLKVLKSLERGMDLERLADTIAQIAILGAAFHDLGKADRKWQGKAREIDPQAPDGLIGRTGNMQVRVKFPPHTPPGFKATLKASELLLGKLEPAAEHLVRAIALAAARHHSSLTNPAAANYTFEPDPLAADFVRKILKEVEAPSAVMDRAEEIIQAAAEKPSKDMIPLALPNDDVFPIYALVGRAILMADREDAAGKDLEQW